MPIAVIDWKAADATLTSLASSLEAMLDDISAVADQAEERDAESTGATAVDAAESLQELLDQTQTLQSDLHGFAEDWPGISGQMNRAFREWL